MPDSLHLKFHFWELVMADAKNLLTAAVAGVGTWHKVRPEESNRGFVVACAGVGAVSATVLVEVSVDGITPAKRMTFSLSGTAAAGAPVTDTDVDANGPFPFIRGNVTAISGTGAAVTLDVASAYPGMGVA